MEQLINNYRKTTQTSNKSETCINNYWRVVAAVGGAALKGGTPGCTPACGGWAGPGGWLGPGGRPGTGWPPGPCIGIPGPGGRGDIPGGIIPGRGPNQGGGIPGKRERKGNKRLFLCLHMKITTMPKQ